MGWGVNSNLFVGPWISWTPTGSWSTNTTYSGYWRQNGQDREYRVYITTSGAPTAAGLTVNLPSGHTIDTTLILNANGGNYSLGYGGTFDVGVNAYPIRVGYSSTSAVAVLTTNAASTYTLGATVTQLVPFTYGNTDRIDLFFKVPIA